MTDERYTIRFTMPKCEAFHTAVALVRATGARGDVALRDFVIDGPTMTVPQVAALLQLVNFPWDGGRRMEVRFDPEPEVPEEYAYEADSWWPGRK